MKTGLLLITNSYPYGELETYIRNELKYTSRFSFCTILSTHSNKSATILQETPEECFLIDTLDETKSFKYLLNKKLVLSIIDEILKFKFNNFFYRLRSMLWYLKVSSKIVSSIEKNIKVMENLGCQSVLIYSYWLNESAFAISLIDSDKYDLRITKISRAHGYDIYEHRNNGYIPFRRNVLNNLDKIYPISKNGEEYLIKKYPKYKEKVSVRYLGTQDYGFSLSNRKNNTLRIITCSNLVQIKRIHLLIDALSKTNANIKWTHIGDGDLFWKLKSLAETTLKNNVEVNFIGRVPNQEVIEQYLRKEADLFINVSESEGLPVTIMEAMSCAVPIIATDVGGTGEIVEDTINGFLLDKDFSVATLIRLIEYIYLMSDEEYGKMCMNARYTWENKFSAKKNYSNFYKEFGDNNDSTY